jgi:hypothetical protein
MPRLEPEPLVCDIVCDIDHSRTRREPQDRCKYLDACWITKVAETVDNDLRAHRIAMSYRHYGLELDSLIHGAASMEAKAERPAVCNANWFNFATWGTLTATQNIGNERAPQRLNSGIAAPLRRRLTPAILRAKAADGQIVGRALAWGQRLVFVSTASALLQFVSNLDAPRKTGAGYAEPDTASFKQTKVWELLNRLTTSSLPSPPQTIETAAKLSTPSFEDDRHLTPLLRAFELYRCARDANDGTRAKLIFGANALVTAVEQDLLNPALSLVVDLVPRQLGQAVDWRLAKVLERWRGLPPAFTFTAMQMLPRDRRRVADLAWSRFMTDQVLVMALPTETLRVGRDIPQWRRDQPYFPADLSNLKPVKGEPFFDELAEIARLVQSLDRTVGDGRGSAARDWRRWDERLNWAVTLLRSRHHDESLFWHPYSKADERRIAAGELPLRSGDPSVLEVQPPLDPAVFTDADLKSENQ